LSILLKLKCGLRHYLSHKQRIHPRGSKSVHRYFSFFTLDGVDFIIVTDYLSSSFTDNMLARIDKKDLAERAKKMRAAAQAPQDLKLITPATTVRTLPRKTRRPPLD